MQLWVGSQAFPQGAASHPATGDVPCSASGGTSGGSTFAACPQARVVPCTDLVRFSWPPSFLMRFSASAGNESCTWCRGHGTGWGTQGCGVAVLCGAVWGRAVWHEAVLWGMWGAQAASALWGDPSRAGSTPLHPQHKDLPKLWMCLATKHPSTATPSCTLCSSSPGANPRALPSRSQPTEGVCCSLLVLGTFGIGGFLYSNRTEGTGARTGLIDTKARWVLAAPPRRPALLAALCPGIYSTVNFERVQRAGKTRWGRGDSLGRAGGCRGSWPRLQQSNPEYPPAHPGPLCPTHPIARQLRAAQGPRLGDPCEHTWVWD